MTDQSTEATAATTDAGAEDDERLRLFNQFSAKFANGGQAPQTTTDAPAAEAAAAPTDSGSTAATTPAPGDAAGTGAAATGQTAADTGAAAPASTQPGGDTAGQAASTLATTDAAGSKADGAAGTEKKTPAAAPASFDWSSATEDDRRAAFERAETDRKRYHNMVAPLQRQVNNLQRQLRAPSAAKPADTTTTTPPAGDNKPAATAPETSFTESEDWKVIEADYPELTKPIKAKLAALQAKADTLDKTVQSLVTERQHDAVNNLEGFLLEHHADFYETGRSDDFRKWVDQQPAYVRDFHARLAEGIRPEHAQGAVDLISQFKAAQAPTPKPPATDAAKAAAAAVLPDTRSAQQIDDPKRQRQLEAAAAPRTSSPARVSPSNEPPADADPNKMFAWAQAKLHERFPHLKPR